MERGGGTWGQDLGDLKGWGLGERGACEREKRVAPLLPASSPPRAAATRAAAAARLGLRVVDVGRRGVVVARLVRALAAPLRVVVADGGGVPGQAAAELVPLAVRALFLFWEGCFGGRGRGERRAAERALLLPPCPSVESTAPPQSLHPQAEPLQNSSNPSSSRSPSEPPQKPTKPTWKEAQRWLMTMSAIALMPFSCSAVMSCRSSASVP